jgi:hypothetical protein
MESQHLTTLWASTVYYRDSFTFFLPFTEKGFHYLLITLSFGALYSCALIFLINDRPYIYEVNKDGFLS